jgi:hypothetical protein
MDTSNRNKKAAARVDTQQDLAGIAARAVERAQAARKGLTELSPEQTEAVSGGLTTSLVVVIKPAPVLCPRPPIVYGGFPLPVNQLM